MFITYLRRELRRRRRQALVVALGLAVGIGLVITVSAASAGVSAAQSTVLQSLYGVGTDITITQPPAQGTGGPGRFDFGQGDTSSTNVTQDRLTVGPGVATMDASSIATVTAQSKVSAAVGSLSLNDITVSGTFTPPTQGSTGTGGPQQGGQQNNGGQRPQIDINSYSITGVDVNNGGVGPLSSATLSSGRGLTAADASSPVALLSAEYATQKTLKVGDNLTIAGTTVPVVGIVNLPSGDTTDVFLPLTEAQTLANLAGKVTTIYVKATSADDVTAAQSQIQTALPGTTVKTSSDLASQISGSLGSAASLARNLGRWLSVAVLIAAFAIAALLTISSVSRRVREFGTLKALGWRGRRIVGQVMGESLVMGLVGGAVGIGLGFLGAYLVSSFAPTLSATLSSGLGNGPAGGFAGGPQGGETNGGGGGPSFVGGPGGLRAAAESISVPLTAPVTLTVIAAAVALAIAGGLIAGGFGGWRASRLRPADALRRVE